MARFKARLEPIEGGTFVVIPTEAVEALRATGRTSVVGTIDGHSIRHQFMPYVFEGVGRQVVMAVNTATRDAIGASTSRISRAGARSRRPRDGGAFRGACRCLTSDPRVSRAARPQ